MAGWGRPPQRKEAGLPTAPPEKRYFCPFSAAFCTQSAIGLSLPEEFSSILTSIPLLSKSARESSARQKKSLSFVKIRLVCVAESTLLLR